MRVALYVPAYRGTVRLEHMRTHEWNREYARSAGIEIGTLDTHNLHIDEARNRAMVDALGFECDRILMMDADVGVQQPHVNNALAHLMKRMDETGAAAVGSVVLRRNGEPNVFDDGQSVGTGLMLIDLRQVAKVSPPWFQRRVSPDGTETVCTGDIAFCRLLRAKGLRVVVDHGLPTVHVGEAVHVSPAVSVTTDRDCAPNSAVERSNV